MLDAADDLVAALGLWIENVVESHPAGLRGPSWLGWRFSRPGVQVVHGEVVAPDRVPLGADQSAVESTVRWLLPHLRWVAEQDWAPDMRRELCEQIARAWSRWPREEKPHVVPMPCPRCDGWSLEYVPPASEGAPRMVTCTNIDCAAQWVDDSWTQIVHATLLGQGVRF